MRLLLDLRRWGWREVVYSGRSRTACRLGWHNAGCRGRRDHDPQTYRERPIGDWPGPPRRHP